jgi:tyrosyl-tRNA synthetase
VPKVEVSTESVVGTPIVDFLCDVIQLGSKTEIRKLINNGAISINKNKVGDIKKNITNDMLLSNGTMLVQKGKKKYSLVIVH